MQQVFFEKWYVLRDWMREAKVSRAFTMDSDAMMVENVTALLEHNIGHFKEHEFWLVYNPPRASVLFFYITLRGLEDISRFGTTFCSQTYGQRNLSRLQLRMTRMQLNTTPTSLLGDPILAGDMDLSTLLALAMLRSILDLSKYLKEWRRKVFERSILQERLRWTSMALHIP